MSDNDLRIGKYTLTAIVCVFLIGALNDVAKVALKRQPGCGATIYKAEEP